MRTWTFPSSSGPKIYTTQLSDNGLLSCDCMGWTTKREGKPRHCKHTKQVAQDEKLALQERDGMMYCVDQELPFPEAQFLAAANPTNLGASAASVGVKASPTVSGFIEPMYASKMPSGLSADDYSNSEWVMEEKYDGHRIIVKNDGAIKAWSRLGNQRTLPEHILEELLDMPAGIYDGELIVPGMHSYDVVAGMNSGKEVLVLFDVIEVLGKSTMKESQFKRRQMLKLAHDHISTTPGHAQGNPSVRLSAQGSPSQEAVKLIWSRGGEGAILKRLSAPYKPGWRSPDYWVKVKAVNQAVLTIVGFKVGESGPYSIVQLRGDDGVETTVKTLDNATLRDIAAHPDKYLGARLVIEYQERVQSSGKYRHPMWDHVAGEGE